MVVNDSIIPAKSDITIGTIDNPIKSLYVSQSSIFMVKDGAISHKIEVKNNEIEFNKVTTSIDANGEITIDTSKPNSTSIDRFFNKDRDISSNNFEIYGDVSGIYHLPTSVLGRSDNVHFKNVTTISTISSNNFIDVSGSQGANLKIQYKDDSSIPWNISTKKIEYNKFVEYTFTNCGATGELGPTQTECDASYDGTNVNVTINTRGIQEWTVPQSGVYKITAYGAAGGGWHEEVTEGIIGGVKRRRSCHIWN